MGPANTTPSAATYSSKKKPRPPLLLSIPIPISSRRRPQAPPPSSPLRYHPSASIEDDLVFAMSPDQNTPPSLFKSRTTTSPYFDHVRRVQSHSSSALLQKYFANNTTISHPFLTSNPHPYSDEPFMYSVPNIKPIPSRPQTPKKKKQASTTNTPPRRHALLKPHVPPRSSATCSSSQTSEDELDVVGQRHKAHPLTSAFSRSISTTTSSATASTASSSANSSVDGLLLTASSVSYPGGLVTLFSNDITASPLDEKSQRQRTSAGFFGQVKGGLPSPSPSRSPSKHNHVVSTSYGLEKHVREVRIAKEVHDRSSPVEEVIRGRPRERRSSRGVDATASHQVFFKNCSS